jgi:hypothetical protein
MEFRLEFERREGGFDCSARDRIQRLERGEVFAFILKYGIGQYIANNIPVVARLKLDPHNNPPENGIG